MIVVHRRKQTSPTASQTAVVQAAIERVVAQTRFILSAARGQVPTPDGRRVHNAPGLSTAKSANDARPRFSMFWPKHVTSSAMRSGCEGLQGQEHISKFVQI
jgi:hypothetical protein